MLDSWADGINGRDSGQIELCLSSKVDQERPAGSQRVAPPVLPGGGVDVGFGVALAPGFLPMLAGGLKIVPANVLEQYAQTTVLRARV